MTSTDSNPASDVRVIQSGRNGGVYDDDDKQRYMRMALAVAERALRQQEVPVGCVVVFQGKVIAEGHNETNHTSNPTRHAEFIALESLQTPSARAAVVATASRLPPHPFLQQQSQLQQSQPPSTASTTKADVNLQKFCQACDLFVTVEPCIMCVAFRGRALSSYNITRVTHAGVHRACCRNRLE